jgi:D-3-phosphoglycerate dehydrogenase
MLKELSILVDYKPEITRDEIKNIIKDYDGLIIRSKTTVDSDLLGNQCKLKFVARPGAGLDLLDVNELEKRNIKVFNSPEGNRDSLGEHALGMLLSLANNIVKGDKEIRQKVWDRESNRGFELKGKTIGIIGYGQMGSAFAEKLSGFSCKVIAYDKNKTEFGNSYVTEVTLQELYDRSDVVSFHIPLNIDNLNLVNEVYLNNFKKNITLVNTARGKILVLNDLLKLLDSGKVRGAALDVLENEKPNQLSPIEEKTFVNLINRNNVVLTPHVGGWSHESYIKMNEVLVEKIRLLLVN